MVTSTKLLCRQEPKPIEATSPSGNTLGAPSLVAETVGLDLPPTSQATHCPWPPLCPKYPDAAMPTTPPAEQVCPPAFSASKLTLPSGQTTFFPSANTSWHLALAQACPQLKVLLKCPLGSPQHPWTE